MPNTEEAAESKRAPNLGKLILWAILALVLTGWSGRNLWSLGSELLKLERLRRGGRVVHGSKLDARKMRGPLMSGWVVSYSFSRGEGTPLDSEFGRLLEGNEFRRQRLEHLLGDRLKDLLEVNRGVAPLSDDVYEQVEGYRKIPITIHPHDPDLHTAGRVDGARVRGAVLWLLPALLCDLLLFFTGMCLLGVTLALCAWGMMRRAQEERSTIDAILSGGGGKRSDQEGDSGPGS